MKKNILRVLGRAREGSQILKRDRGGIFQMGALTDDINKYLGWNADLILTCKWDVKGLQ